MTATKLNLSDFEASARRRLPAMEYEFFAGGSDDEVTLRSNREAYQQIPINFRVLVDVDEIDTTTSVLGVELPFPVMIAPTAFQKLAHPDAELATVRGAGAAGTVTILSTFSTVALEEVVAAATTPVWFQLYVYKDRSLTADLVARAEAAGCGALVVTVDAPWLGNRERDARNSFHLPEGVHAENAFPAGFGDIPREEGTSGLMTYIASHIDATLTWEDMAWLKSLTSMPLVVKGIVRGDDAVRAAEAGADAIVVSNHGGRQLDTSPATINALPQVVDEAGGRLQILVDGGVRRGTDVLKALARGAQAVLVGRPVVWGLAADPDHGVASVLTILRDEFERAMALAGCRSVDEITDDLLS